MKRYYRQRRTFVALIAGAILALLLVHLQPYVGAGAIRAQQPTPANSCTTGWAQIQQAIRANCSALAAGRSCLANLPASVLGSDLPFTQNAGLLTDLDSIDSVSTDMTDIALGQMGIVVMKVPLNTVNPPVAATLIQMGQNYLAEVNYAETGGLFTPGKSLLLSTGSGMQSCPNMPASGLLIQVPAGQVFELTLNSVTLTIQGTLFISALNTGMQVLVLEGTVTAAVQGQMLTASSGQMLSFALDPSNFAQVIPPVGPPTAIDATMLTSTRPWLCDVVSAVPGETAWCSAAAPTPLPSNSSGDTLTLIPVPTATAGNCTKRTDWLTYMVQSGDTLSSIALRTNSTVAELMAANCKTSTVIFVGEQFYVPRLPAPPTPLTPPQPTIAPATAQSPTTAAPTTQSTTPAPMCVTPIPCDPLTDPACSGGGIPGGGGVPTCAP